jgi:hypothetical protein
LLLLGIIGFMVFLNGFEMFDEPTREIVRSECDYEGLRQATIFTSTGNATANPSMNVSVKLGCDGNSNEEVDNILFTADSPFLRESDLEVKWESFDTLRITYDSHLRVFKEALSMEFKDSTLNFVVDYQKKK